ncbi:MAG: VOC family protein [Sphingobacteriales bacterium]|nr:MAG: VOC family protein [Sphingobacteriales bacterium]
MERLSDSSFDEPTKKTAMNFYKTIFRTEFQGPGFVRFGSMPASEGMPTMSDEQKNMILHVELPVLGGHILMATDVPDGMGMKVTPGNNIHINLEPDSREETQRLFDALSEGGNVTMPLQDMFWGAFYGSCTDRYGINWMVNFDMAK